MWEQCAIHQIKSPIAKFFSPSKFTRNFILDDESSPLRIWNSNCRDSDTKHDSRIDSKGILDTLEQRLITTEVPPTENKTHCTFNEGEEPTECSDVTPRKAILPLKYNDGIDDKQRQAGYLLRGQITEDSSILLKLYRHPRTLSFEYLTSLTIQLTHLTTRNFPLPLSKNLEKLTSILRLVSVRNISFPEAVKSISQNSHGMELNETGIAYNLKDPEIVTQASLMSDTHSELAKVKQAVSACSSYCSLATCCCLNEAEILQSYKNYSMVGQYILQNIIHTAIAIHK